MEYKQELQKEFSESLSYEALTFIFNETDFIMTNITTDQSNLEDIYSQIFFETAHKFIFGRYNNNESKNYFRNYLTKIFDKNINDLKKIKLICDFYKKIKFSPDIEHMINLLKNNAALYNCIANIYEKNQDLILNDTIEKILDDDIFIQFIEVYLDINNIEKVSTYEIEIDEPECLDSTKMLILELYKYPVLKHEQIINLFKKLENGDKTVKNIIIEHNLRLVLKIAKRYSSDQRPLLDLFQEGTIGLNKAVERFDYKKGYKFSTYATWLIRQAITRYITDKCYTIRIPATLRETQINFKKIYNDIRAALGKNPTIEEIAENSNYDIKTIKKILNLPDDLKSLNEKIKDTEDSENGELIHDDIINIEEETERKDLSFKIQEWLDTYLTPKEKIVLINRMGLDGKKPRTYEDIGSELKLSRERVRQIQLDCIRKLRRSKMANQFIVYTEHPDKAQHFLMEFSKTGPTTKAIKKPEKAKGDKKMNDKSQSEPSNTKEDIRKNKSRKNLYKYFPNTEEEIDKVIEGLTPNEKTLLKQIYGEDLKNPLKFELSEENKSSFYNLILKIKRRLDAKPRKKVIETKRTIKIYDYFSEYPEDLIDKALEKLTDSQKETLRLRYGEDLKNPQIKPYIDKNSQQRLYNTIKRLENILKQLHNQEYNENREVKEENNNKSELYNNPYYLKLISKLPINESIVMYLRKNYSTSQIAETLNVSTEDVIQTSKNALLKLKAIYSNIFDEEIKLIEMEQQENIKTK